MTGSQLNRGSPARLLTTARLTARATTAMPATSRSSLIASAVIISQFSCEERQRPPGAARVLDKGVFQVQFHHLDSHGRLALDGCPLPGAKVHEDQFPARPHLPV